LKFEYKKLSKNHYVTDAQGKNVFDLELYIDTLTSL
jgi:hypothetical protein